MEDQRWKVGELANETGVTVRTLHHYDEIGLLQPLGRTAAGHRIYTGEDVARLQLIQSLRSLGFGLEQIGRLLDDGTAAPLQVIQMHLARVREDLQRQQSLCARLESIADRLAASGEVAPSDLIDVIQEMETMKRIEAYYTTEQLDTLEQRRKELGESAMRQAETDWVELLSGLRAAIDRGADPKEPEVQALGAKYRELLNAFSGGDAGILQSLKKMYHQEPNIAEGLGYRPDPELAEYLERIFSAEQPNG